MRLILMRHAKAIERSPHIFKDDSRRPLSEEGVREHKQISKVLKAMGIKVDQIVTSPYDRAKTTAKITRKVYDLEEKPEKWDELADDFSVDVILDKLSQKDPKVTIVLVGHEPTIGILANALLRIEGNIEIDFKKSGVMCISFLHHPKRGEGTLEYFLRPKLLRELAKNAEIGPSSKDKKEGKGSKKGSDTGDRKGGKAKGSKASKRSLKARTKGKG